MSLCWLEKKQEALVGAWGVSAAGDHSGGVHGAVGTVWWLAAAKSAVEERLGVSWLPCRCPSSICGNTQNTEAAQGPSVPEEGCEQRVPPRREATARHHLSAALPSWLGCASLCPLGLGEGRTRSTSRNYSLGARGPCSTSEEQAGLGSLL